MENKNVKNIITIGASAGGLSAVATLLSTIPKDIDAAIFIVIHLGKSAIIETVLTLLNKNAGLKVQIPKNGTPIESGNVYLAPVDEHMVIEAGQISIFRGPTENHWRPSIDVLFRTAAAAYDSCVTGIILSGLLDDGTSGMIAIKKAGGTCIVQEPDEAEFSEMPQNVINNLDVDYRVSIADIGYILSDIFSRGNCIPKEIPAEVKLEADITKRMASQFEETEKLGKPTSITCPNCGGILTEIEEEGIKRYRCFTGHTFSQRLLDELLTEKIEETIWVAIRMMEERRNFISGMEKSFNTNSFIDIERKKKAEELKTHVERLKEMLKNLNSSPLGT